MQQKEIYKYIVISPIRNEENYIEKTIISMISQSIRPHQWIIVDDCSNDNTVKVVSKYVDNYDFIVLINKPCLDVDDDNNVSRDGNGSKNQTKNTDRLAHAAEVIAFNYGLKFITDNNYDFIAKIDGDISFGTDYFEKIFQRFESNPKLGIASGYCYQLQNDELKMEKVPTSHVRGASKVYRRACFDQIGGIRAILGWDTIDELQAQMKGWVTQGFQELQIVHYRPTGSVGGVLRGRKRHGFTAYILGYHPIFLVGRAFFQIFKQPFILGGFALLYGFITGYIRRDHRVVEQDLMLFLRKQQIDRMLSLNIHRKLSILKSEPKA